MSHNSETDHNDKEIAWVYNPWRTNTGPAWRKPWLALVISVCISALLGYSMSYPNYPQSYITAMEEQVEAGGEPEEIQTIQTQLDNMYHQQEYWQWQMLGWGGIAFGLLMAMTATLYLPIRYRLDEQGVTVFFLGAPNFRKWEYYRNFYVHDTGVHLTTMPTPSALDPFRGHYLRFAENRVEVVACIKAYLVVEEATI